MSTVTSSVTRRSLVTGLFCGALSAAVAPTAAQIPDVVGRASLAAANRDFELRDAALSPDGRTLWVVAAARPKGQIRGGDDLVLATFAADTLVAQEPLNVPGLSRGQTSTARPLGMRAIEDMAFAADGRLLIALARGTNPSSILPVDTAARTAGEPLPLALGSPSADVHELVRTIRGRLLAVGVDGPQIFVAELADDGKVTRLSQLQAESALIERAVPVADGGVLLVGRRGSDAAAAEVWLGLVSAEGELVRSARFPARDGVVAALQGGGYAAVLQRAGARGFDVTLHALEADLRERWSKPLATDQVNPWFDVAPVPSGGFVVAGTKDRGLWVTRYAADGTSVWTEHRMPEPSAPEMVFNLRLFTRGETFVLPYTAFTVEDREQRQSIRVITFTVR